ncbi:MAG: pyridoxal phosphate-dependent aminotransferase [Acidimicrobiia bacterium]|nr:pyridoxal phosphate-dependent aminotransferase [Acidimicrobiia bacterium]
MSTVSKASIPKQLNSNLHGLRPSATLVINEHSTRLRSQGRDVFKLGFGQSPFPVPAPVVQELQRQAHRKEYLPVRGLPELRDAVASFHQRLEGIEATGQDVLIGPGSKELMFLLQLAYDADLLLPSPSWVSYAPQAQMLGRRIGWMETSRGNGWRLLPETLEQACARNPDRRRILVLNYPNNPSGLSFTPSQLEALAEVARRYRIVVLADEIYGQLHHAGGHVSIARYYPEGAVITSGLSKWCGAGGWRLGTMTFPGELRWLLDAVAVCASETYTTASAPVQCAAVTAFQGGKAIEAYLKASRAVLSSLGKWVAAELRKAGAEVDDPDGGFYLFPQFSAKAISAEPFCRQILEETGVALLPGVEFGRPEEELTARLCYVDFDGAECLAAVARGESVDEAFLRNHCARTVAGVNRLCEWLA